MFEDHPLIVGAGLTQDNAYEQVKEERARNYFLFLMFPYIQTINTPTKKK